MKKFVPLFESFNNESITQDILTKVAKAVEEASFFEYVSVRPDNAIHISRNENVDWDTFYVHDESVRMYSEYSASLKLVFEDDVDDLIKLYDAGLTSFTGLIKGFMVSSSVSYDSKDVDFYHEIGDPEEETLIPISDFGIEDGASFDTIGNDISEWLKEDWYGMTYGLNLQDLLDKAYPEYEDEDEEDDDEQIDETLGHDEPFISWACEELGIDTCPTIEFGDDHDFAIQNKSMAYFHPGEYRIYVLRGSRTKADWLRSLAHELVHAAQFERGEDLDGSTGSPHENEANSKAGQLLRAYGKIDSTIYEG
jgi:hypothetical protein